jgi:hypothetical protein
MESEAQKCSRQHINFCENSFVALKYRYTGLKLSCTTFSFVESVTVLEEGEGKGQLRRITCTEGGG